MRGEVYTPSNAKGPAAESYAEHICCSASTKSRRTKKNFANVLCGFF